MKILLSAYACEPNRGSEPGIGWQWSINMASDKEKEVYVLTRSNNQELINAFWEKNECPSNLHYLYYDLPSPLIWAKHHGLPVNLYYAWWLIASTNYAKQLHKQYCFDMAHHITFGVFRDPCPLYKLGIPYVVGPAGGGEETPQILTSQFSWKERVKETLRWGMNKVALANPMVNKCFDNASLILTKTKDTKDVLSKWENKTCIQLELGINDLNHIETERDKNLFLFVGRFTYWKGIKLVLNAFKQYSLKNPEARLLMIGKGEMENEIIKFTSKHKLNIEIIPWIKQEELKKYYSTAIALLFPSLHDSSGNVVLESLSFGLPVICLQCGGPASVMGNLTDTMINPYNKTVEQVVDDIVLMMHKLANDNSFYDVVKRKSLQRASEFIWKEHIDKIYDQIKTKITKPNTTHV